MPKRNRHNAGFSLVEVLVTLAVLGILTGIAIPSVLAWMPGHYIKESARDMKGAMVRARSHAINKGVEHRVLFDLKTNTYQVDQGDLMTNSTNWTTLIGPHPLASGISINRSSAALEGAGTQPFVRFSVKGSVVTNVDTLAFGLINNHNDTYDVSVQRRTGHVTLTKGG